MGNSHWSRDSIKQWALGNPNLCLDQPITKGWCQPIGDHVFYPTDSPIATTLGVCSSLWNSGNQAVLSCLRPATDPWNTVGCGQCGAGETCLWLRMLNKIWYDVLLYQHPKCRGIYRDLVGHFEWHHIINRNHRQLLLHGKTLKEDKFNIIVSTPACWWHGLLMHDDVIKWKHFLCYWPFARGIHRSPVNSLHKGQWRGALMFSLICARINGWVNNREAGYLRRNHAHYDVIVTGCMQLA